MLKKSLLIAIFFVFLCQPIWGQESPSEEAPQEDQLSKWEKIYGVELVNIPLPFRQQFMLATGQAWADATFDEQCSFLDERAEQRRIRGQERQHWLERKDAAKKAIENKEMQRIQNLETKRQREEAKEIRKRTEKEARRLKLQHIVEARRQKMEAIRKRNESRRNQNK